MPEYMTKCEPVDKKPYIVYTDEKGILYSGDPDSDIPGGGGDSTEYNIACYHFGDGEMTPIDSYVAPATWDVDAGWWGNPGTAVAKAKPGDVLVATGVTYGQIQSVCTGFEDDAIFYPFQAPVYGDDVEMQTAIVMPAHDIYVIFGTQ